jgi:arsenate reductase
MCDGLLIELTRCVSSFNLVGAVRYIQSLQNFEPSMTITIYGIPNCDTMKKARAWLSKHAIEYAFHDYKKDGIERKRLEGWSDQVGWETLLNRAGTTFRKLPDAEKAGLDRKKAVALMAGQPSMIKRPVLDIDGHLLVGFKPGEYEAASPGPTSRRR